MYPFLQSETVKMTDLYGVGVREIIEPLPLPPMMATFEKVSKVKKIVFLKL